ncbi:hypothetical protein MKW98_026317 [Papaver atlanticum]|uniref:Polyadenylate-binding protein n=1 Tax=Papaver atlanticum TaxID=357466 RepID=A0AAD4SQN8_9MAGN|nr:hypothetical protein MKW98_026317 [Papaver atlanticum]
MAATPTMTASQTSPSPSTNAAAATIQVPASLYVGDLHCDVTDSHLDELFSRLKNFASARVCRDSATGRSLGYGYANFITPEDAIRAIEKTNHTLLNGKSIRVMWSNRDAEVRKSGIGNLFVKNLNDSIDNVRLQEVFSEFGNIMSCKVAMSQDGKSKGYGFVQFESEVSANQALEKLNGSTVEGKQIYVATFVKKSDRALPSPDSNYTNLYMKNLDLELTEEQLQEKFSVFGKITNLIVTKDNNGKSKGFGFVNFEIPEDAKRATEAMNGTQLGSKVIYVGRAQKRSERDQILRRQYEEKRNEQIQKYKGSNVYVKNIEDGVDEDELREHFSQCGTITSVKLMRDDKGICRGFGFVCYSTPEEANQAVSTFHGYMFHHKPLYVAIAQRKEDRQAQLQLQYGQRMAGLAGSSAAVIPAGYSPLYYTPPGVIPQMPPRQGLMYQPLGMRPGWRTNGFLPTARPTFQPVPLHMMLGAPRPHRHNRGRMTGPMYSPAGRPGQAKYVPNGRQHEMNNGSAASDAGSQGGLEMLSSMLAAASPQHQKQILGEYLFPLVQNLEHELAAKITGMLLEMDNSELLLLLESPESLAAKVDEAVQVLKLSKAKAAAGNGQEVIHSNNFLSTEVAVN